MNRIIQGIEQFQRDVFPANRELFARLASGQKPEALFIACSDSRVSLEWITQCGPGDLFVCRNAGNMEEGRATIRSGRPPSSAFYQTHQNLLAAIADLASSSFSPNGVVQAERERLSSRIRYSLILLGIAVLVAILGAVFTVYFVNRMFLRLRWQAAELTHLSSRTMLIPALNRRACEKPPVRCTINPVTVGASAPPR